MKIIITIIGLIFIYGCSTNGACVNNQQKQLVVKNKRISVYDGSTIYMISYTNGNSERVSYGIYCNYEINDTMCLEKDMWKWYVIDCETLNTK